MRMFASNSTVAVYKTKIVFVTKSGIETAVDHRHIYPFGPWRMKVVVLRKLQQGSDTLNKFLNRFYEFKLKDDPGLLKDFSEIRVYRCKTEIKCRLVGSSLL